MPSPFPGMDPWLEQPGVWENLHTSLITALRDTLAPRLRPRYYIAVEQSAYISRRPPRELVGIPELSVMIPKKGQPPARAAVAEAVAARPVIVELPYEEIVERYLEIRKPQTGEVVTAIEILSPKNKRPGEGRVRYDDKRSKIVSSQTHLVEIDLLRDWEPMEFVWPGNGHWGDYRILISRAPHRPRAELYPFDVREPIPRFLLPLLPDDTEPLVDLKSILDDVYDRAGFDLILDYTAPPVPPLSDEDAAWAAEILKPPQSPR